MGYVGIHPKFWDRIPPDRQNDFFKSGANMHYSGIGGDQELRLPHKRGRLVDIEFTATIENMPAELISNNTA